jgi:molybdopterin converting factor subunit 1
MNQVTILFFATLRDKAGARSIKLVLEDGTSIAQLKLLLVGQYPALDGLLVHCLASINREYCFDETNIPAGAEIAFFPPVSGGCI